MALFYCVLLDACPLRDAELNGRIVPQERQDFVGSGKIDVVSLCLCHVSF